MKKAANLTPACTYMSGVTASRKRLGQDKLVALLLADQRQQHIVDPVSLTGAEWPPLFQWKLRRDLQPTCRMQTPMQKNPGNPAELLSNHVQINFFQMFTAALTVCKWFAFVLHRSVMKAQRNKLAYFEMYPFRIKCFPRFPHHHSVCSLCLYYLLGTQH